MKLRIILGLIVLSYPSFTWAQVSKESYDKAVDFLNCKSVELSLQRRADLGEQEWADFEEYQQRCPCGNTSYEQISSFLSPVAKVSATIELSKEIQDLKGHFIEDWDEENVVAFLTDSIFAQKTKYQAISGFTEKRKDEQILIDYKETLKRKFINILEQSSFSNHATDLNSDVHQPALMAGVSANKNHPEVESESQFIGTTFHIISISLFVSLIFSLLTLLLVSKLRRGKNNTVQDSIKNYIDDKIKNHLYSSQNTNNTGEVRRLKDELEKIKDEMKILRSKLIPMEIILPKEEIKLHQIEKEPEIKPEIFFISTPNSDGSFNESSASSAYKEGASIYRFTKIGHNTAEYHIEEKEASVKLAIQYPELRIDPLCDAENGFNPKATRILTVQPGEAELQGDKWVINIKAIIRYES